MRDHRSAIADLDSSGLLAGGIPAAVFTKRTAKTPTKTV